MKLCTPVLSLQTKSTISRLPCPSRHLDATRASQRIWTLLAMCRRSRCFAHSPKIRGSVPSGREEPSMVNTGSIWQQWSVPLHRCSKNLNTKVAWDRPSSTMSTVCLFLGSLQKRPEPVFEPCSNLASTFPAQERRRYVLSTSWRSVIYSLGWTS